MKKFVILLALFILPGFIFAEQQPRGFINTGCSYEYSEIPTSLVTLNFDVSVPFNNNTFMGVRGDLGFPVDDMKNPVKRVAFDVYSGVNYTLWDFFRVSAYPIAQFELPLKKNSNLGGFYGGAGCSMELVLNGLDVFNFGYDYLYSFKNTEGVHRWYLEIPLLTLLEILLSD